MPRETFTSFETKGQGALPAEARLVVIDASLAVNLALPAQPYHGQARQLFLAWAEEDAALLAPPLYESEVDSVLRRYRYRALLSSDAADAAQEVVDALPVRILHDSRVRTRARQIAESFGQDRVYDATYAALAEVLHCEFWTADRLFHRAVGDKLPFVRFIGRFTVPHGPGC